jgi:hypothetical protein
MATSTWIKGMASVALGAAVIMASADAQASKFKKKGDIDVELGGDEDPAPKGGGKVDQGGDVGGGDTLGGGTTGGDSGGGIVDGGKLGGGTGGGDSGGGIVDGGTLGGGTGDCKLEKSDLNHDATIDEFQQGYGDWKWGLDLRANIGFDSDCRGTRLSADAGLDVKLYGVGLDGALVAQLSAGIDASQRKSFEFSLYALNQEIYNRPIVESTGEIFEIVPVNVSFPANGYGKHFDWSFGFTSVIPLQATIGFDVAFHNAINGVFGFRVSAFHAGVVQRLQANVSASVSTSAAIRYDGAQYGSGTATVNGFGFYGEMVLEGSAEATYKDPYNSDTVTQKAKIGPPPAPNGWQVHLLASKDIYEALSAKGVLEGKLENLPEVCTVCPTEVEVDHEFLNVDGLPNWLRGVTSTGYDGFHPFTF